MRKISANYIFPISQPPIKNGILIVDDEGVIHNVIDPKNQFKEIAGLEFYNGILVPGFINAHCHIELSYLKNKIGSCSGLPDFIKSIIKERVNIPENIVKIIENADAEMQAEGIVAVGDIINGTSSFEVKRRSKIIYKSFIETFDISPSRTESCILQTKALFEETKNNSLFASIVPHAPYSVTPQLFSFIKDSYSSGAGIYSVHNQETESENSIFGTRNGIIYDMMTSWGADFSQWSNSNSSLQAISEYFPEMANLLLIHNVFTNKEDIEFLKARNCKVYFVLCPASNLIIENRLPDIDMIRNSGFPIAIGTDSYASNTRLSVLEELKIISKFYPKVSLNELLLWATLYGAKAIKEENLLGSFEKNKKPGINLIEGIDFEKMAFTDHAKVKKLE